MVCKYKQVLFLAYICLMQGAIRKIQESVLNYSSYNLINAKLAYISAWQGLPEHGLTHFLVKFRNMRKEVSERILRWSCTSQYTFHFALLARKKIEFRACFCHNVCRQGEIPKKAEIENVIKWKSFSKKYLQAMCTECSVEENSC